MALSVTTRFEWVARLASQSKTIADMHLDEMISNAALNSHAINFANCKIHQGLIVRATEELVNQKCLSSDGARDLLADMITRNTYGAFSELAGYDWFLRSRVMVTTGVKLSASDVLGANGSILNGKCRYDDIYFDLKAFGLHGRLAQRLKQRLEEVLPGEQVLVEESWDLSEEAFTQLIVDAPQIAKELKHKRMLRKGRMHLRIQVPQSITVSGRIVQPYLLAKEYALYPFKDSNQFTRRAPFILVFILHPWLNANTIGEDFAGGDTCFTRSLARRAFFQFSSDSRPLHTVCDLVDQTATLADAVRLLSAIFFVNVWPMEADIERKRPFPCWLFSNPRAIHQIYRHQIELFQSLNPNGTYIDDFADDDY